jgi:hypothetical protein
LINLLPPVFHVDGQAIFLILTLIDFGGTYYHSMWFSQAILRGAFEICVEILKRNGARVELGGD